MSVRIVIAHVKHVMEVFLLTVCPVNFLLHLMLAPLNALDAKNLVELVTQVIFLFVRLARNLTVEMPIQLDNVTCAKMQDALNAIQLIELYALNVQLALILLMESV